MKYIKVRQNSIKAMQGFCDAVDKANIINDLNIDLTLDPNVNYNILENKQNNTKCKKIVLCKFV